ncbi:hypothetical protein H0H93_008837 [Arthromyces matolae]|nr:hypothetical protein H0H93_008837 [Arthromyces matolae]
MPLPAIVDAITIPKTGGVQVIEKRTVPFAKPAPGSIVIKASNVEYLGINFIDTYYRQGLYALKEVPGVLGEEIAGTIVALPTDEDVVKNETYRKNGFKLGGKVAANFLGTHATYSSVPWKYVYPIPDDVSTRTACAALIQGLTACSFTEEAYKVVKGDTILIHTVAGGLGLLMAQIAHKCGATVIGTTSTPEKAELAKKHGADHVILYKDEDTVSRVLEITRGEGVDAIFDGVGQSTFDNNFKIIKRKGTIVSLGNASGRVEPFTPLRLVEKNVKLLRPTMSNYTYTAEEAQHYGERLFNAISNGSLRINVYKEYPFTTQGVQQAHIDLVGGKTTGKLIVKICPVV